MQLLPDPVLSHVAPNFTIVRDDLLDGGSKMRFLPALVDGVPEVVYGGPFCGGAPLALSVLGKTTGKRVSLFYAKRRFRHPRQVQAAANGAKIFEIDPGYMTNVQAKARAYAKEAGALFLPLGFDVPAAREPFVAAMAAVRRRLDRDPDQVWCAAGSGMLARCLAIAFPDSQINAVVVGLPSRHGAEAYQGNVVVHGCAYKFEQPCRAAAPFPTCENYDRKAWEICRAQGRGRVLFWNVLG